MKSLKLLLAGFLCLSLGFSFYGCADETSSMTRDFTIKYWRHKLYNVCYVDDKNAWVSGDYGLIWRTQDGGDTWQPQKSGTILPLRGVSFSDTKNGWAVGDQGTIIHTADGGNTWAKQESGIKEHLQKVNFLTAQKGFAIGVFASFLRTKDGGQTWEDISQQIKEPEKEVNWFIDGAGAEQPVEDEVEAEDFDVLEEGMPVLEPLLNDIFFVDSQNGWIVAEESNVFHTKDGGETWFKGETGSKEDLFGVFFKDTQEGWITGLNGLLLHTSDGGATWEEQECPVEDSLFAIRISGSRGYAVGNATAMITTTDGGKTWQPYSPEDVVLFSWFRDLTTINGRFVAVGGLGMILISDTEGQDWKEIV
jgi:photosystem II stability/assembly factor-like uncharacterized protein